MSPSSKQGDSFIENEEILQFVRHPGGDGEEFT